MSDNSAPEGFTLEEDNGFNSFVGPLFHKQIDDETFDFRFKPEQRHLNGGGVVHGGMLMSFADHVLGRTVWEATGQKPSTTMSLNCDFVSPGRLDEWIGGTAQITRKTRSIIFVQGLLQQNDKTLMTATGIWKILGA